MDKLRKPPWWSADVEFDPTGETQREWAREGASAYRAAQPGRYGEGASVNKSVTAPKSGTRSVTNVSEAEQSVTVSKGALRAKKWREKQRR